MSTLPPTTIIAGTAAAFQLLRLSVDIVQAATATEQKHYDVKEETKDGGEGEKKVAAAPFFTKIPANYGAVNQEEEKESLLEDGMEKTNTNRPKSLLERRMPLVSNTFNVLIFFLFLALSFHVEDVILVTWFRMVATALLLGAIVGIRDYERKRYNTFQKLLQVCWAITTVISMFFLSREVCTAMLMATTIFVALIAVLETAVVYAPTAPKSSSGPKVLSRSAVLTLLKPYFWPDATSSSAFMNRIRAVCTWVCVILSKVCGVVGPILLGWASTALSRQQYGECVKYSIAYAATGFFGSAFKEGQSLVYLKVAQAAFVQLSETAFWHLHSLSLDWHLRKKLGEVLRSMDRGIAACDTLMKYLFLWLFPALGECIVVCVIFATYFDYWPLALSVALFVWIYILWTIVLTLWRKKFRKAVVKSDNDWHDRCTDSLVNFETVKYFTAELYEMKRFGDAVKQYQSGSVDVQASLSFLNLSQKFILQTCLATSLSMAALGIKKRWDCCVADGCEDGNSECCSEHPSCTGMEVGDFVAVLTYTIQLFQPLNFLGSVYNTIVMAIIDLTNLSELLAESPDVFDAPDAFTLPKSNTRDAEDIAVEFDNVVFHYPTQPSTKGLKGLSFKMKRGTTTAVVGPTGAGKTTISRLLFRFYDVMGGAVKVNGVDVRSVTQKSLRGTIGVVPQTASLFNDTLRANVLYGRRDATEEELNKAAQDAQLSSFVESLDEGWESMVGDRGLKLSGGEQQRTSIARCLLKDPPFVVLDEATSALDTLTENSVQQALDSLGNQRTVLVIAHRLGTIRNADNIIVLKDGVVAEEGNHDELLARNGIYADMWNMQLNSSKGNSRSNLAQDFLKEASFI